MSNEGNILQISNGCGFLSIDDEITNGMRISYYRDDIALCLCGLYSLNEIRRFLANERRHLITSRQQTKIKGKKKVSHTEFSKVNIKTGEDNDFKVILYSSEGIMYQFPMVEEEWNEMVALMARVINGDKSMKYAIPFG
ncbi:hypothetical protein [Aneurinibacillus tyrosinisolvens]|uniref:hypothetical protein n=1 Tax=Aneurinibacillus tyrosinisolvens TaxID=1443435 RepID=UPI00063FC703|nr:hypothetical protein [Aneurinibacillus tyrosinisolvens]